MYDIDCASSGSLAHTPSPYREVMSAVKLTLERTAIRPRLRNAPSMPAPGTARAAITRGNASLSHAGPRTGEFVK